MFKRKAEDHQGESMTGLEAARKYTEIALKSKMRYRAFLNNLKSLGIRGRYLDVGAGPGIPAAMAAEHYSDIEITALETSQDMVTIGEEYLKSKGLEERVRYVKGDAAEETISSGLGKFDLVYSVHSLHHWENPKAVIENCMKHVADNGVLFIHDLKRVWWLYVVPINNGFFNSIRASYVKRELKELLKDFPHELYTIKKDFPPFMHSIIIRKSS